MHDLTATPSSIRAGPPYEWIFTPRQCDKITRIEKRFERLDSMTHVWVRDARGFAHGRESGVEAFSMTFPTRLPVAEIRDRVQEKYMELSKYSIETDGPLHLLFEKQIMQDGTTFDTYMVSATTAWPKPYAGVIWVIPFRTMSPHLMKWGSAQ